LSLTSSWHSSCYRAILGGRASPSRVETAPWWWSI